MKSSFSIRHPLSLGLLSLLTLPVGLLHGLLLGLWHDQARAEPDQPMVTAPLSLPARQTPVAVQTSVIAPPETAASKPSGRRDARPKIAHARPAAKPASRVASPVAPEVAPEVTSEITAQAPLPPLESTLIASAAATPSPSAAPVAAPVAVAMASVIYPTQIPPPQRIRFKWRRGFLSGHAALDWQHDGQHYDMHIQVDAPFIGAVMVQSSRGRLDSTGLAPERHTDRRKGVSERALSVQRQTTPAQLSFSSKTDVVPFAPGSQDKLSWMVQTAAILEARAAGHGGRSAASNAVDLVVAGVNGAVESWHIQTSPSDGLIRLIRPPATPFETRTDIWLDPAQHHMPVRIRLSDPGGDPLELTQVTEPEE